MQTKEYRTVDKSEWPRGPWDNEPDKMQWQDEATGLPCLIVRGPSGALCGYVGVAVGHALFGVDYNDVCRDDGYPEVHGGLTFSGHCAATDDESRHICHTPDPGEPDHVWWLGFDCAHSGDICPEHEMRYRSSYGFGTYKRLAYVRAEVSGLAAQIASGLLVPRARTET